uniref:Putative head-elevated expression protein n=1 Tax=Xenopsylla cheopis TaxID=163159 RepID=A0A6M2DEI7_XENCH
MGAQQSNARTLTVENDDPTLVIKVSEELVDRLKGKLRAGEVAHHQQASAPQVIRSDVAHPTVDQSQAPIYYPYPGVSSIQLMKEKEEQIRNNDQYWQNRIKDIERHQKKMSSMLEKEYEAAMNEIKQTFSSEPSKYQLPPCGDMGSKLMSCYQTNANAPLKCSTVFQEYSQCVNVHRMQTLTAKAS